MSFAISPLTKLTALLLCLPVWMTKLCNRGTRTGQVEINYGNPVKVTWHFAPVSDQIHTFVLSYQVMGVFQKAQNADVLNWIALPTDYIYVIRSSTITVSYPERAVRIGTPEVVRGSALVTTTPGTVVFSANNLKPKTQLEIGLKFRSGSVITQVPQWQQLQELSITLIPPFLLGGLAIFVIGSLGMIWYYRRYRRKPSIIEGEAIPVTSPPDDLPPAIAGALLIQTPNWNNALSTLFDLAKREVLFISQSDQPKSGTGPNQNSLLSYNLKHQTCAHTSLACSQCCSRRRKERIQLQASPKLVGHILVDPSFLINH